MDYGEKMWGGVTGCGARWSCMRLLRSLNRGGRGRGWSSFSNHFCHPGRGVREGRTRVCGISYCPIFLNGIIRTLAIHSQFQISHGKKTCCDLRVRSNSEVAGVEATGIPALVGTITVLTQLVIS